MKKTKIAFDFDKVFVNYPPFVPSALINYLYKKRNHNLSYRIPGKLEQKIRVLSHSSFLRLPIKKNIEVLSNMFTKDNLEIFLISSRFSFLREKTNDWNRRNNMAQYFKKMFFNFNDEQPHLFKDRIIKQENIQKFVDDDLDLLLFLAKNNPRVKFYWIGPSKTETLPPNIAHIRDLKEFFNKYV